MVGNTNCETPRQVMQVYGQLLRATDVNHWINQVVIKIAKAAMSHDIIIIDDLRFENEAQILKSNNAILIRVNRNNQASSSDISEVELDNFEQFDFHFINNSPDVDTLNKQLVHNALVRELLDIYGGQHEAT